jgi:hypothetical protein
MRVYIPNTRELTFSNGSWHGGEQSEKQTQKRAQTIPSSVRRGRHRAVPKETRRPLTQPDQP